MNILSDSAIVMPMGSSAKQKTCNACGHAFAAEFSIGFRDVCPQCQAYLHCCLNCRLYDKGAYHQCRSSTVEFVQDKQKGNFCEEFDWVIGADSQAPKSKGSGKGTFDQLFGD